MTFWKIRKQLRPIKSNPGRNPYYILNSNGKQEK